MMPCPRRSPHSIFSLLLRWLVMILRALILALTRIIPAPQVV